MLASEHHYTALFVTGGRDEQGGAAPLASATQAGQPQLLKGIGNVIEGNDEASPPALGTGIRPSSLDRPWTTVVRPHAHPLLTWPSHPPQSADCPFTCSHGVFKTSIECPLPLAFAYTAT